MPTDDFIRPFQYYTENGKHFCPKCGKSNGEVRYIDRTLCKGGFFRSCPNTDHFHHKCGRCGGKWMEGTYETRPKEMMKTVVEVISWAIHNRIDPTEIRSILDDHIVSKIMTD